MTDTVKTKQYSSYAEIDHDLKILEIEREIHYQKLQLNLRKAKENLKLGSIIEGYLRFSFSKENYPSIISKGLRTALPFVWKLFK